MADIRWTKNQKQKLEKAIKNFNSKVSRLRDKHPNDYSIPDKVNKKSVIQNIKTARDLNNLVKRYQRFTKRGNELPSELNPRVSRWLYREAQILQKTRNREIDKIWKENKIDIRYGNTQKAMQEGYNYDRRNLKNLNQKEIETYIDVLTRKTSDKGKSDRAKLYKQNFLSAIRNSDITMDDKTRESLERIVNSVTEDELIDLYFNSRYIDVGFLYPEADPNSSNVNADLMLQEFREIISDLRKGRKK